MSKKILTEIRNSGFSLNRLTEMYPEISDMKDIPQNPVYHAEGDVYRHIGLVCERLPELPDWYALEPEKQELLFLAAAFHDIGKVSCTKQEDGNWVSPRHTLIGEKRFRSMAYKEQERFGLTFSQREIAAGLIRYHGLPVWFWTKEKPEFELLQAAERMPLRLLYLLSAADVRGRSGEDTEQLMSSVELFGEYAKELGIWEKSWTFTDAYTRFQYFHRDGLWRGAALYNDTEFDVYLMAGLPLAGKDSWIEQNGGDLPMVSLDAIREKMGIPPARKSGQVVHAAIEQARKYLRNRQPFIWNATNLLRATRARLVSLFAGYGARVHIVYLEVPCDELFRRNQIRTRRIPENVLEQMIRKLEVPAPWEGYTVKVLAGEGR